MRLQVKNNETLNDNICKKCARHKVVRFIDNSEIHHCTYFEKNLPLPVVECNAFYPNHLNGMSLQEMYEMAWNLRTDKSGQMVGFCSPKQTEELVKKGRMESPTDIEFGNEHAG